MNWLSSHGMDALLKTAFVVVLWHAVVLTVAAFFGEARGWFGLRTFWPHFSWGLGTTATAVVILLVLYWLIYSFWHENEKA